MNINPEFQNLIPGLSPEEFSQLEKNIIADGCRDPIVLWEDTIIDGHNRYKICTDNDLEYSTTCLEFDSTAHAIIWIIDNVVGKRNLTDWAKFQLMSVKKVELLKIGKERISETTTATNSGLSTIDKAGHSTRNQIAEELGWSTGKLASAEIVQKEASSDVIDQIKAGEITINKAYKDIKKDERKNNQLKKEAEASKEKPDKQFTVTDEQDIIQCDALITDPPYGILSEDWDNIELESFTREWLSRWNECGADIIISSWSQRHLFDGKIWFDEELKNYKFQQLLIWHYSNNKSPQSRLGFKHTFEPIFMYRRSDSDKQIGVGGGEWGKGLNDFDCHVSAMPQSNFNDQNMKQHPAQKSVDVMRWLVNATTRKGDLVVDPFCGSGTTGIASMQLGRSFHGIEINKEYIEIAKGRIAAYGQI